MPVALSIGNFIRFYGHDTYQNKTYPTSDHIIPYKRFLLLYGMIPNIQAFERISNTHSHVHALAMVNSTDKQAVKKIADLEFNTAYDTQ